MQKLELMPSHLPGVLCLPLYQLQQPYLLFDLVDL